MAAATNAQTIATQIEKLRGEPLRKMWLLDKTLFTRLSGTDKDVVSTRPERIPMAVLSGGKARVANLDGGDLGRGSGPTLTFGNLPLVYMNFNMEWTTLSNIATNSKQKSTTDYLEFSLTNGMAQFKSNLDSLLSYGDSTNTLGVVTSYTAASYVVYVDNANRFYDGQDIDITPAIGTAPTQTVTILSVDGPNKALYLTAAPATAPAAGNILLQNNSSGLANSGMSGPLTYHYNGNQGSYLGINRAAYPGKFSTPHVAAGNTAITPAMGRLLLNNMKLAMGVDATPDSGYFFHMGLDQYAAWENTGLNVTQMQTGGTATGRDTLPAQQVTTIGGIEIVPNIKAIPQRIDLMATKNWIQNEIQPLDFLELDGRTTFPIYGASGGPAALAWSTLIWGGNFACLNPRGEAYLDGLPQTQGY